MNGKRRSTRQPNDIRFFLDESLPPQVGEALRLVEYPITTPVLTGKRGYEDEDLLPWLAEEGYVWVTKDEDALRRHRDTIIRHELSVVWVRGLQRKKGTISIRQVFLILAVTLPRIERELSATHRPRHYLAFLRSDDRPAHSQLDLLARRRLGGQQPHAQKR